MRKELPSKRDGISPSVNTARFVLSFLMIFFLPLSSFSQATLLKDIGWPADIWENEYKYLINGNGTFYFVEVNQLWKSDGTVDGTTKIKGFETITDPIWIGNLLYFTADDGLSGPELWKSDGTSAGTVMIKDIMPGSTGSAPDRFADVDGTLFFVADDGIHGREVWKSNGTSGGTVLVKDIIRTAGSSNPSYLTNVNGTLFFAANDGQHGYELWKSNGTGAGTVLVKDINASGGSSPESLTEMNGAVYFIADNGTSGRELFKSNGTPSGTMLVKDIMPGTQRSGIENMTAVNNNLFFTANDGIHGAELWKTNGTPAGTVLVRDMTPGRAGSHGEDIFEYRMGGFANVNGTLFFAAYQNHIYYIWKSDGTAGGTIPLQEATGPTLWNPRPQFTYLNGFIYYFNGTEVNYNSEYFLYRMDEDGSNIVQLTSLIFPDYYNPYYPKIVSVGDHLYFSGQHDRGMTLFKSDGTVEGTREFLDVRAITIGSNPGNLTTFNGKIYFTTDIDETSIGDYSIYDALWETDGTPEGTREIIDDFGSAQMAVADDYLYIVENGYTLWKVDKSGVLSEVKRFQDYVGVQHMVTVGNMLYFATEYNFWRSDGTPEGTFLLLHELGINSLTKFGAGVMFRSGTSDVAEVLWKSSGTPETTVRVKTIRTGGGVASRYYPAAVMNNIFYFVANDGIHGNEVWRSNGTSSGTYLAFDINGNDKVESDNKEFDIASMAVFQNTLYFSARQIIVNDDDFWSLRSYDGQGSSTGYLRTNDPITTIIPAQDRLYLLSLKTDRSRELWTYQPGQPLLMLTPLDERYLSWFIHNFDYEIVNDVMYYASTGSRSLWRTDGTVCGTVALNTETIGAYPMEALGDQLIFSSYTTTYGSEPFIFDLTQDPGSPCEPIDDCTASGTITREYWSGVQGARVSDIPLDREPASTGTLTLFEGPTNIGTNYGARIRGYICPPATGNYRFYISSNDHSELWLSSNDDPSNKIRIAYVTGATGVRQWDKFASQRSSAIHLTKGTKYYIEALHKQGIGTDHVAVGWALPDGTLERPIPGSRLSPFEGSETLSADMADQAREETYARINVYPNPVQSGDPVLTISGYETINENVETQVEIVNMTGETVISDRISCGGDCGAYLMNLSGKLVPGIYLVKLSTNGVALSRRLLVR